MNRKEHVAREQAVVSLRVSLTVWPKHERQFCARISSRRAIDLVDRMEAGAIKSLTAGLAKHFAPFALFIDDRPHEWHIASQTVQQALIAVPIELRAALVQRGSLASRDIAQRIFDAIDREYRLVPLTDRPNSNGPHGWPEIFEREFGPQPHLEDNAWQTQAS